MKTKTAASVQNAARFRKTGTARAPHRRHPNQNDHNPQALGKAVYKSSVAARRERHCRPCAAGSLEAEPISADGQGQRPEFPESRKNLRRKVIWRRSSSEKVNGSACQSPEEHSVLHLSELTKSLPNCNVIGGQRNVLIC